MKKMPSADKVLKLVRDAKGPLNWALVKADAKNLTLHNGGGGSVEQMREWLAEDEVLFGLVRMGFGSGRFRRTYWLFVHWIGPNTPTVKKGRDNANVDAMKTLCRPFACAIAANDMDEIELVAVIERMRSSVVVEKGAGENAESEGKDLLSLDAFKTALKEEQEAEQGAAAAAQLDEGSAEKEALPTAEILKRLRDEDDPINWAFFSF